LAAGQGGGERERTVAEAGVDPRVTGGEVPVVIVAW
jgi:hypothetical protein